MVYLCFLVPVRASPCLVSCGELVKFFCVCVCASVIFKSIKYQDGDRRHLFALARLLPHHHAARRVEGAEISRETRPPRCHARSLPHSSQIVPPKYPSESPCERRVGCVCESGASCVSSAQRGLGGLGLGLMSSIQPSLGMSVFFLSLGNIFNSNSCTQR